MAHLPRRSNVPILNIDGFLARWFHARLNSHSGPILQTMSFAGSGTLMSVALVLGVFLLAYRRRWQALITLILSVPLGIVLGEVIKVIVRRPRPYVMGPFVDWAGYSFPSGHAISATLFYGFLVVWLCTRLKSKWWRALTAFSGILVTI